MRLKIELELELVVVSIAGILTKLLDVLFLHRSKDLKGIRQIFANPTFLCTDARFPSTTIISS